MINFATNFFRVWLRAPFLVALSIIFMSLSACVQTTSFPSSARTGDTIVLGVGGINRNAGGEQFLTTDDFQEISLTDSSQHTFMLGADNVFKAFPGYRSVVNRLAIDGSAPLIPFDGGWFVVVSLTDRNGVPLPLAAGPAHVKIISNKLVNGTPFDQDGDLNNINLDILPGQGGDGSNSAFRDQFQAYMEMPGLVVRPSNLTNISSVAGLQLVINFTQTSSYRSDIKPAVVPMTHNPYVQLAQRVVDNGGNSKTMNVLLTTQKEFAVFGSQTTETPLLSDLNLSVMYFDADVRNAPVPPEQLLQDFTIDLAKSYYVDKLGNKITTMVPTLSIK